MKSGIQQLMLAIAWTIGVMGFANATLPEPKDPQIVANMTFEERLKMSKDLRQQFKQATPAERSEYRQKLHAKLDALSPEVRNALREKMRAQWEALTPEQRKELQDNRKAMIASMTSDEKAEIKKEREQWMKAHPDEKNRWNQPMNK